MDEHVGEPVAIEGQFPAMCTGCALVQYHLSGYNGYQISSPLEVQYVKRPRSVHLQGDTVAGRAGASCTIRVYRADAHLSGTRLLAIF